jgi:hypothetical protein
MTQPATNSPLSPSSAEVGKFHNNSDSDSAVTAQHHTLGIQHNQASPGDHKHDGHSSKRVGKSLDLAFPVTASATYNQAQIQSIINALRALGWGT